MSQSRREDSSEAPDVVALDPAALARAEALMASLRDRYPDLAARTIEELNMCWAAMPAASDVVVREDLIRTLDRLAHDFKGIGGSYGYPLVSTIGGHLGELARPGAILDAARCVAIGRCVAALNAVIRERLAGDGGERGRRLLESLMIEASSGI